MIFSPDVYFWLPQILELNKQPLLILVICLILGIAFQEKFCFQKGFILFIAGFCLLIPACTFFISYFLHKARPYLLAFMFFGIGALLHFFNSPLLKKEISAGKDETIIFRISKKLNSNEKYRKYEIAAQKGKEKFNAVLSVPKTEERFDFKHYYKTRISLSEPRQPQYDFQFDYAKYLQRKGIGYQCYTKGNIESVKRNDLGIGEKLAQERLEVINSIDRTSVSPVSREFLKGIILADRTETDAQTVQDFNRSGLVHFLAISGTHIVIIFGLMYFVLIRILPLKFRKLAIILSLVFIWLFTGFIGFGSSVVRSAVMLSVYFIYVLLQRKPDLLHSMALAALVILIADTQQLFDIGFQLSFLAVLGIYRLNQPILNCLPRRSNWFKKIVFNTVSMSLAAQLATLPLVLYYFHQFSFVSVPANFFIVPFSELVIVFSFLMTALIAPGLDMGFINTVYDHLIQLLLKMIHWFAGFDGLFFENIAMNGWEAAAFMVVVWVSGLVISKPDLRNCSKLALFVSLFIMLRYTFSFFEYHRSEVLVHRFSGRTAVSVKKGNAACFWLGDSMEEEKAMRYLIYPYCASRRIDVIEVKKIPAGSGKLVFNGKIYSLY